MIFKLEAVGRLVDDARVINGGTDKAFTAFTLVTNDTWKDKTTGEKKEKAHFVDCTINGEKLAPYIQKGGQVAIIGVPYADVYTNRDGEAVGKLRCRVDKIELLGGRVKGNDGTKPQTEEVETF